MTELSPCIHQLSINTIRTLSMDAVEAANSGHPGTPMALAPLGYLLYQEEMRYDPAEPLWPNRDRFVLSCGHASMLLYSLLHLVGVKQVDGSGKPTGEEAVPLEAIRQFRQWGSRCPGHPEHGFTSGVETTTGPLGQGVANSVGMAMAAGWLASRYNRQHFPLFDYNIYAVCSDGDLMEGVAQEAASLAGHLKLDNLCWIYDDNSITIEGNTSLAFSEDVERRFQSLGWNVIALEDINELSALRVALKKFRETKDAPTLILVRSVIAFGAPNKANTHGAHGAPLGAEEIRLTKIAYDWQGNEPFFVPEQVRRHFAEGIGKRGATASREWQELFEKYRVAYPQEAKEIDAIIHRDLPNNWASEIAPFVADAKGMASRVSSGKVLNQIARNIPWLIGGSADLAPSNNSYLNLPEAGDFSAENKAGRNLHFGIREHAMTAIVNGLALSGLRAYGATFFVFTDYMRPAIRLAALMELPVFYILTHDSIGVGEDGPTHQPIEHLAALRAIPNLLVLRPADANEVAEAYKVIFQQKTRPSALILTRQNLPTVDRTQYSSAEGLSRGAYILSEAEGGKPKSILIGTGSEVSLCLQAQTELQKQGHPTRVVSMPSWELFEEQDAAYKEQVFPTEITSRVAVEMAIQQGWERYMGPRGKFIGMSHFGASAPLAVLLKNFGFTTEKIVEAVLNS